MILGHMACLVDIIFVSLSVCPNPNLEYLVILFAGISDLRSAAKAAFDAGDVHRATLGHCGGRDTGGAE